MNILEKGVIAAIIVVVLIALAGCSGPAADDTTTDGSVTTTTDGQSVTETDTDTEQIPSETTTDEIATTSTPVRTDPEPDEEASPTYVVGNVTTFEVEMPQFDGQNRTVRVYTPPEYSETDHSYPVVYMQDGQNLFDNRTAFNEEWRVDETMERLAREGSIAAIVVGVDHAGARRADEYIPPELAPSDQPREGDAYAAFMAETLKPSIDDRYRTMPNETAIFGSSLGGIISIYTAFEYPDTFQYTGGMSNALPPEEILAPYMNQTAGGPQRVYTDWGTDEGNEPEAFSQRNRNLVTALESLGYERGATLMVVEDEGGIHRETAWRERFPRAIQWLLTGEDPAE